jgi:hypothetical protein
MGKTGETLGLVESIFNYSIMDMLDEYLPVYSVVRIDFYVDDVTPVDRHYIMTAEEASELIREQRGIALLPRDAAWRIASEGLVMRPLAEEQLKLVTRLVTRSDNESRLVSEYVRAQDAN